MVLELQQLRKRKLEQSPSTHEAHVALAQLRQAEESQIEQVAVALSDGRFQKKRRRIC